MPGEYDHLPAYDGLRVRLDGERKRKAMSARERLEASKSPERRAAEASLRARKLERDREFEARESQRAASPVKAAKAPAAAAASAAPAKAAASDKELKEKFTKGFAAGRMYEQQRAAAVLAFAKERGQAAEALDLLAGTELVASDIIAKLKSRNLLADAMRARFGEAAQ